MDDHIKELDGCKATKCPHPRPQCVEAFPSVLEMKFHLQDVRCIELTKSIKRCSSDGEGGATPARRKRSRKTNDLESDMKLESGLQSTYEFFGDTAKLYGQRGTGTSTTPSTRSERSSPSNTSATDDAT